MTKETEQPDRLRANFMLSPEHRRVLGDEIAPVFCALLGDHQRGKSIPVRDLVKLLHDVLLRSAFRFVDGRNHHRDRLWVQDRMLELVEDIVWYLAGPRLRLVPRSPVGGDRPGMVA